MLVLELETPSERLRKGGEGFNFDKIAGHKHTILPLINASSKKCNKNCNK